MQFCHYFRILVCLDIKKDSLHVWKLTRSRATCPEVWFWLAAMLLLTWPYRWFFRRLSSKVYVIFIKELEVWYLWCTWSENDHLKEENSQIHIPYCQYKVVILIPINFWPHNFYYILMRNIYFFLYISWCLITHQIWQPFWNVTVYYVFILVSSRYRSSISNWLVFLSYNLLILFCFLLNICSFTVPLCSICIRW